MEIDEAKKIIFDATADDAWVERCNNKRFVRFSGTDQNDQIYFEALELLHTEGSLVQVPSAGQSRSSVSFRRANHAHDVKQLK